MGKKDGGCRFYHDQHASLTQPIMHRESHIFAIFVPVLMTLCMLGLRILELILYVFMSVGKVFMP